MRNRAEYFASNFFLAICRSWLEHVVDRHCTSGLKSCLLAAIAVAGMMMLAQPSVAQKGFCSSGICGVCVPEPGIPCPDDGNGDGGGGVNGNGDGGGGVRPIVIPPDAFVAGACVNVTDLTSACFRGEMEDAARKLGAKVAENYLWGGVTSALPLYLPNYYPTALTAIFLLRVAKGVMGVTLSVINNDLERIQALQWTTEEQKRRARLVIQNDERIIERWNKQARDEAERGINWSYLEADNTVTGYAFRAGPAYQQLKNIQGLGWLRK